MARIFDSSNLPTLSLSVEFNMSRSWDPFVLPPELSASQKKLYKPPNETSLRAENDIDVNEVIGEYREGNVNYYYARYDGGIAHRVRVYFWPFKISIIITRLD